MTSILHDGLYAEKQAVTWEKDGAAYEIGGWYADPPTFPEMPHSWAPNDATRRKCRSDYKIASGAKDDSQPPGKEDTDWVIPACNLRPREPCTASRACT
jgi:hypothetical protein